MLGISATIIIFAGLMAIAGAVTGFGVLAVISIIIGVIGFLSFGVTLIDIYEMRRIDRKIRRLEKKGLW